MLFPGALGDAVCVEPAVRHLALGGPVEFVARGAAAEVARLFPAQPVVHSLDDARIAELFSPIAQPGSGDPGWLDAYLRVVSFTGASSAEFVARAAAHRDAQVVPFPRRSGEGHAIDLFSAAVGAPLGLAPRLRGTGGEPGPRSPQTLCIHPGAAGAAKRFPRSFWEFVVREAPACGFAQVCVLLGPLEADQADAFRALACEVVATPDVAALASVLAVSGAFIGCDSGPGHVAAALGGAAAILFRSTDPHRFGARGPHVDHHRMTQDPEPAVVRGWLRQLAAVALRGAGPPVVP